MVVRNRLDYTGAYSGDSTQLTYLRARFYASGTGRFLTRDTWGGSYNSPQSLNRWSYTQSNPVNYTDPSGNCIGVLGGADTVFCLALGGFVAGAVIAGGVNAAIQYSQNNGTVDFKEVTAAAVGGGVAGSIIAVAAPVSLAGAFIWGGVSSVAGSQTTSAVSAVLSPTGSGFLNDYSNSGGITDGNQVTNLNKLAFDFVIGGSVNMAFTGAASWLSRNTYLPISDPLKTSRPIIPQVGFQYAPGMNGALPNSQTILISGVRYPYLTLQQSYLAGLANQIVDKGWDVANEFCSQSLLEKIYPIP